ncbi:MAG: glycyl-tRNA synthetase [Microgenomates group bacterium Gr01-1014_80]|nr:MAG: glycyl-tRNA synthetase [Microgenomates group bacterium Gr01-1014_80]
MNDLLEKVVALCKRRGFIYPGSEIYGGLGGTWDYGPLGVELKRNIRQEWWKDIVQLREDIVGVDASIMMNPKVWEASGHIEAFTDPLIECKICHERVRADQNEVIKEHEATHDGKSDWTEPQKFNLLVKASLGVLEGKQQELYLRGEITQGVHVNFKNVLDSTRIKIPFGIAQIGKAFRNEITPGNFTFRSREFEQMEVQFYIKPDDSEGQKWFDFWKNYWKEWYTRYGIDKNKLKFKDHEEGERAHYAKAATDLEYEAPWGWAEFMGIHHRGDWDLRRHQEYSGANLGYRDPETGEEYLPWDIESSAGVDRSALFFLLDAYSEENGKVKLKLNPKLAPYKVAVFPLLANKPELLELAKEIYIDLKKDFQVCFDERGNIGGRYAAQDEIGTPFCVTVDFQSLEDQAATVRFRDTGGQERVKIDELQKYIAAQINSQS